MTSSYRALALQVTCDAVNDSNDSQASVLATIASADQQMAASRAFIGASCQLVVLPEYFLTSFPMWDPLDARSSVTAIEPNGREEAAIGADRAHFVATHPEGHRTPSHSWHHRRLTMETACQPL
jgi:predicted amidohydrolase